MTNYKFTLVVNEAQTATSSFPGHAQFKYSLRGINKADDEAPAVLRTYEELRKDYVFANNPN